MDYADRLERWEGEHGQNHARWVADGEALMVAFHKRNHPDEDKADMTDAIAAILHYAHSRYGGIFMLEVLRSAESAIVDEMKPSPDDDAGDGDDDDHVCDDDCRSFGCPIRRNYGG
jgi:hypothetical protein